MGKMVYKRKGKFYSPKTSLPYCRRKPMKKGKMDAKDAEPVFYRRSAVSHRYEGLPGTKGFEGRLMFKHPMTKYMAVPRKTAFMLPMLKGLSAKSKLPRGEKAMPFAPILV